MKARLLFIVKYFLFWILIFFFQKLSFMIFNYPESIHLSISEWFGVFWHGLRLDMSAAAYLLAVPLLLISFLSFFPIRYTRVSLNIYSYIFLFIVLYLGVVDMELYSYWGVKLDIAPLVYLKTPKEAVESTPVLEFILLFLFLALVYYLFARLYRRRIVSSLNDKVKPSKVFIIAGLFVLAFSFIPIRGGVGIAPLNLGSAYFSSNRFANHSAINVPWNCIYSLVEKKSLDASFTFMDDSIANEEFSSFYPPTSDSMPFIKPGSNVILIILESFSDKLISELGGEEGITPQINKMCNNSLVFTNFFATGDRSEKGMIGIFSGYPAQPTTSIIEFPSKTQNMPFLTRPFHEKGYYTSFYYGGDLNFANFRSYFTNPWMDRVVTKSDFPQKLDTQKWGVPDEFLFAKMINDIDTIQKPFFLSCFSLSSHEPYDIPMEPVFPTSTRNDLSKNAFYYTDSCLGKFISDARQKPWWDNTLIIIIADHGSRYPGNTPNHVKEKFRIPMIWTGGAVTLPPRRIEKYASQTDIAHTVLSQFGFPASEYKFSKDIFDPGSKSFATYFFNNGFGLMSDSIQLVYDNNINDFIINTGNPDEKLMSASKAYLQVLSRDFSQR